MKKANYKAGQIKDKIIDLVGRYYKYARRELPYNKVPVTGKVYDEKELKNLVEASLEGWWTDGRWGCLFENKLKEFLGIDYIVTTNSGSSANLIAVKTLTSIKLGDRRIKPGDEIITTAAGFPTTINPIIDIGAIPVFADVELGTYNVNVSEVEQAITPKTRAIFLAHTLGNPFNLKKIKQLCEKHSLWLIEDNCDALGSRYEGKFTGTFGDLATLSFYPAHHITTAEGGAVLTNDPQLHKIARSFRDWGRDCWCPTGKDDTCGKRFSQQFGNLPYGYDHKYVFSEIGYNMKITDLQAAIGVAQMDKLDRFIERRKENFGYLSERFSQYEDYFILPEAPDNSDPSWFGYLLTIRDSAIDRTDLMQYLNRRGVATRLLFCGNVLKQPYFVRYKIKYRSASNLANTDIIMKDTFWIGVYPALTKEHIDHVADSFAQYTNNL